MFAALFWNAAAVPTRRPSTNTTIVPKNIADLRENLGPLDGPPLTSEEKILRDKWKTSQFQQRELSEHNLSLTTIEAATTGKDDRPIVLSHDQLDAIIAADESPSSIDERKDHTKHHNHSLSAERKHIAQIYKLMKTNFEDEIIHLLFHSSDGKPRRLTDEKVDEAIRLHEFLYSPRELGHLERDKFKKASDDMNKLLSKRDSISQRLELDKYNVSDLQIEAATKRTDNTTIVLDQYQLDAIIAADQSPTKKRNDHIKHNDHRLPAERKRIAQIYKVMKAGAWEPAIYGLFHAKGGKPRKVTDEEVDQRVRGIPLD